MRHHQIKYQVSVANAHKNTSPAALLYTYQVYIMYNRVRNTRALAA